MLKLIKNLSLIRQLVLITLANVLAFSFLIFGYLNVSIDSYTTNQIFELMVNSQEEVLFAYESGIKNNDALNKRIRSNMEHIIIVKNKQVAQYGTPFANKDVVRFALTLMQEFEDSYQAVEKIDGEQYYFCFKKSEDNLTIITIADSGFSKVLRNSLLSGVVDILLVAVLLVLSMLLMWMGSIIYPINQITAYIEKIRKGEPAELNIQRKDEIGSLADSLVAMNREIETQEKVKVEMLHNISHDFKTPIATIKSYAESIKDGVYPYDTLEKSVDVIYDNANRLEKKVQSLLLLNRFTYVLDESSDIRQVAMQDIINKTILGVKVIRPDMKIHANLQDVYFLGNQESWRVVVENIIDNALRYADSVIEIVLDFEEGLLIKNDGPPLEEDKINNFFKPYEKGSDGQFGLGLSIVKRVCNVYGYEVNAYNKDNMVVFEIQPKYKPAATKQKKTSKEKKPAKGKEIKKKVKNDKSNS